MTETQKIEAITKDILAGYYGTTQNCGTETQNILMLTYKLKRYLMVN